MNEAVSDIYMPAVPLYLHRLADAILAMEALPQDWIDRRTLEEALGVSKWTAWRVLKQAGATEGPGNTLACPRQELLAHLRALQQDHRFAPEIARRQRVGQYLDGMVRYATSKHKEIARNQDAETLLSSRFQNLPPGVELSPGELRIAFFGTEDFLQKFAALVYALQNDFEKIAAVIEADALKPRAGD